MTVNLFITLIDILSIVSSVLTEAFKKVFGTAKPTLIAAIVSAITGWGGGTAVYILLAIPFTATSITALILLAPVIWLGATLGYDKVKEIIKQIAEAAKKAKEEDNNEDDGK